MDTTDRRPSASYVLYLHAAMTSRWKAVSLCTKSLYIRKDH
jgi:hypothetical protein